MRPPQAYPAPGASAEAAGGGAAVDPQITSVLVQLAEGRSSFARDLSGSEGTPVADILALGSPVGYNLRNRFLNLGIPLTEGFASAADPVFRQRLLELARWDKNGETRSAALLALARTRDVRWLTVFNEALVHLDASVRFGALEALATWGQPERAMPLLAAAAEKDSQPILRVYAAGGLARLGDPAGLARLRLFLDDPSWVVRAMAAKFIGERGTAEDYVRLLNRVDTEAGNDFVTAELCVSALKLFPKKLAADKASVAVAPPPVSAPLNGGLVLDRELQYQLDPLVVTAPRVKVSQADLIDPRINRHLLRLLQQRMNARPDATAQLDPQLTVLGRLSTLAGYSLKTRYTELGFLLTEGLAGAADFTLQSQLENAARLGTNVQIRAAALVALAYAKDARHLSLFQGALNDPNITVRFAALESLLILNDASAQIQVAGLARTDRSLAVQIYAAAGMWRAGDVFGREILLRSHENPDWFVRAMAAHYLGELGSPDEAWRLQRALTFEQDPSVKVELADALLKIAARGGAPQ
ncbi:MAG: HEAT repeat domain-containing protein [Elusimicrobia bacterium]|nr:HEAT repeat domain-containing protein [Elusimicrobiota bacterium]